MPSDPGETTVFRTIGRYRTSCELGRGAMGVVYRAFDPLIGRPVALKTLSIDTSDVQAREFRERLYREAAAAGALSHPNIVTIFDIIEDGGVTAVAMEYIEGRSLAAIIGERAPLPTDVAIEILDQVCSALDYAGSQGIVHRDVKPANILVTSAGRAKVTDFGVARLALSTMTQAGTVLGSPSYMSPEQVKGLSLDGRSDLFSAAVVFFEMVTRERPFTGNDIATTMYRIAHEPPTPPTRFNPAVSPGVWAALERAFAKSPSDRFQTGADLVAALRAAASLGSTRGSAAVLAALAAAPPPVPPVVEPMLKPPAASTGRGSPAEAAPIPVGGIEGQDLTGSGGQALAPIPGAGLAVEVPPSPSTSNVELPAIPLPPDHGGSPALQAEAPPSVAAPSRRARGRGPALAAGVGLVVVLGIAGAIYFGGAAGPWFQEPAETAAEPPPLESSAPAGPMIPAAPAAPLPGSPVAGGFTGSAPPTGTRAPAGAAPRAPAATQSRTAAAPSPPQPAAAVPSGDTIQAPAVPQAAAPARVYQTTEVDVKPEVLVEVAPTYPDEAAAQKVQDVVVLQVLVDAAGKPQTIKLLRGSRKAPLLDGAAAAAVRQWAFRPAKKNGQPVACWFNVGVPFPPAR